MTRVACAERWSMSWTCLLAALALRVRDRPRPLQPRALALQAAGVEALGRGELDRAAGPLRARARVRAAARGSRERPGPGRRSPRRLDARRGAVPRRARAQRRSRGGPPQPGGGARSSRRGGRRARSRRGPRSPSIPATRDARLLTAELLLRLGKLDDARWELEKLCAAAPERADAHAANALVLARLGSNRGRGAGGAPGARHRRHSCPRRTGRAPRSCAAPGDLEGASRELDVVIASGAGGDRRPAGARHRRRRPRAVGPGGARAGDAGSRPRRAGPRCISRWRSSPSRAATGRRPCAPRTPRWRCARTTPKPAGARGRPLAPRPRCRDAARARAVSRRGAAGHGRRTRPRRTNAARARVRS